jgi:hypothetical protein
MGSSKHDERAYPAAGNDNERSTRKLLAVFERLAREAQDDIVYACWAAVRVGRNPFDAIAEGLAMLSRDRMTVRGMLARYLERSGSPMDLEQIAAGAYLTKRERLAVYGLVARDLERDALVRVLGADVAADLLRRLGVADGG